jgi:hypothetical protein
MIYAKNTQQQKHYCQQRETHIIQNFIEFYGILTSLFLTTHHITLFSVDPTNIDDVLMSGWLMSRLTLILMSCAIFTFAVRLPKLFDSLFPFRPLNGGDRTKKKSIWTSSSLFSIMKKLEADPFFQWLDQDLGGGGERQCAGRIKPYFVRFHYCMQ